MQQVLSENFSIRVYIYLSADLVISPFPFSPAATRRILVLSLSTLSRDNDTPPGLWDLSVRTERMMFRVYGLFARLNFFSRRDILRVYKRMIKRIIAHLLRKLFAFSIVY